MPPRCFTMRPSGELFVRAWLEPQASLCFWCQKTSPQARCLFSCTKSFVPKAISAKAALATPPLPAPMHVTSSQQPQLIKCRDRNCGPCVPLVLHPPAEENKIQNSLGGFVGAAGKFEAIPSKPWTDSPLDLVVWKAYEPKPERCRNQQMCVSKSDRSKTFNTDLQSFAYSSTGSSRLPKRLVKFWHDSELPTASKTWIVVESSISSISVLARAHWAHLCKLGRALHEVSRAATRSS